MVQVTIDRDGGGAAPPANHKRGEMTKANDGVTCMSACLLGLWSRHATCGVSEPEGAEHFI